MLPRAHPPHPPTNYTGRAWGQRLNILWWKSEYNVCCLACKWARVFEIESICPDVHIKGKKLTSQVWGRTDRLHAHFPPCIRCDSEWVVHTHTHQHMHTQSVHVCVKRKKKTGLCLQRALIHSSPSSTGICFVNVKSNNNPTAEVGRTLGFEAGSQEKILEKSSVKKWWFY